MKVMKKEATVHPNSPLTPKSKKGLGFYLRDWRLWLLLLPAVIYVFIFSYIPMYGVQIAFRDYTAKAGIWGSKWVGLKHFIRFFNFPNFKLYMENTLRLGIYGLSMFPVSIIFALMLNEVRSVKFKKAVQMISYMPYFLSTVVVCSMILLFFDENKGFINTIIEFLGGQRIDFLTRPEFFDDIYVLSNTWQVMGFGAIIYVAALANVPTELVEAARIDGASRLQIIWHIYLPSIMPTIIIMLIFSCGGILSASHEKILLLQNSLNLSASQVISTYTYKIGIQSGQFSYATAIGLFNNIVNVIILAVVNTIAKKTSEISIW